METEIQFMKGVGPRLAPLYQKLGIHTVGDLLFHAPHRYEDRRNLPKIREIKPGTFVTVRGKIAAIDVKPSRGRAAPIRCILHDGTAQIGLIWFNQPWIAKKLREAKGDVIAYGQVKEGHYGYEIAAPEFEIIDPEEDADGFTKIVPVYPLTEGLQQRSMRKATEAAIEKFLDEVDEYLPTEFRKQNRLVGIRAALRAIHRPDDLEILEAGRRRLIFDEFLLIQLHLQMRKASTQQEPGIKFGISELAGSDGGGLFGSSSTLAEGGTLWDEVHKLLPFELTGAQRRVIGEIWKDMETAVPMNRLVQGDVGSGKTAVAACAILAAVRCGYQAALMAPTEILAEQHSIGLKRLFSPLGINVNFLAGKLGAKEKRKVYDLVKSGEAQIVVGTHALIQADVEFKNLGLAVIDEQHRFGVLQRLALRQKAENAPDMLVMTATPIPRTLSMTLYGDLDVSIINELPPGRKPIKTHWKKPLDRETIYEGVKRMLEQGRQAYFVCPAITESEKMQTLAAVDLHERLSSGVYKGYRVGLLHGQLKPAEKEVVMEQFRMHELDILVATVVIEVGVDVPNASVMVVEDANRFGLSQLHQIRGRVGRGEHASFCILIADGNNPDSQQRMEVMVMTQDGFVIAEEDLKLRGPGDLMGTKQSGNLDLKIADLVRDFAILEEAQKAAQKMIAKDPQLREPDHRRLANMIAGIKEEDAWISKS
jgi:ATP-dependent DNA helicase RecG